MKYKVLNNKLFSEQRTRGEYLYDNFCLDKSLSVEKFIHDLKTAYYKYDAEVYTTGSMDKLKVNFIDTFNGIELDKDLSIVDIGAGTGETYDLVKNTQIDFSKYYFIEPFSAMIDEFPEKDNIKIQIICDYFDSQFCTNFLQKDDKQKLFIMCGVLRTLHNINDFADVLKENMKKGDKLYMPVEPNNNFFGKYFLILSPLIFIQKIISKLSFFFISMICRPSKSLISKGPLDKSVEYLKNNGVVNDKFTVDLLYAVVYYNNYLCWKHINIPDDYNEGFFTLEQFSNRLDCKIEILNTRTYLYGASFGLNGVNNFFEKVLSKFFPKEASTMTCVITKK